MVSNADVEAVAARLGREPTVAFEVVTRDDSGAPAVIRNAPFDDDGAPMPTLYWLVDPEAVRRVGRLESEGGVKQAEAEVDPDELLRAHAAYAAERDRAIPRDRADARPSGGVGGTARGVKCLHAHYAYFLAGGDDPVGRWVEERLSERAP
ncbi:MAG: DUF501 domain-containing protein [Acidimicrobiia bacterium]